MEDIDQIPAHFCSDSIRDAQKVGSTSGKLYQQAVSLGLIDQACADRLISHADRRAVQALAYCYENYGMDALRRGSRNDPTGLDAIIGPDTPSDPEGVRQIVATMAAARRGAIHDE